jgi:hypothetical protein
MRLCGAGDEINIFGSTTLNSSSVEDTNLHHFGKSKFESASELKSRIRISMKVKIQERGVESWMVMDFYIGGAEA